MRLGWSLFERGGLHVIRRELVQAEACMLRARELLADEPQAGGILGHSLGSVYARQGRHAEARQVYRQALEADRRYGRRRGEGAVLNALAEIAREDGHLAEAESLYERSIAAFRDVSHPYYCIPLLNLGMVQLERGELQRARPLLEEARQRAAQTGMRAIEGASSLALLPCVARAGDWLAWDRLLQEGHDKVLSGSEAVISRDLAIGLELAAREAHASEGGRLRALETLELARAQYRALDDQAALARLTSWPA